MRRLFVVAVLTTLLPSAFAQKGKPACDRACLESYVDKYIDAMLAHDPSPTLFAKNIKFTENGVRLPFGNEGLWYDMAGKGTYKFYIPDIETQQIAFIGTARKAAPLLERRPWPVKSVRNSPLPAPNPVRSRQNLRLWLLRCA